MLSERKYCYCQSSSEDNSSPVTIMAGEVLGEWSKQPPLPQHNCSIPDDSEKLTELSMVNPEPPEGTANTAPKRPSIIGYAKRVFSSVLSMASLNGTKLDMQPSSHCLPKHEQYSKQTYLFSSPCIPIFETNKNGKGQLTVPLDYSSTIDDISMTPAGVYTEDMAYSECPTSEPERAGKRRKNLSKTNQQHAHTGSEANRKGCDKNRKEKKRHALRRDILSDNRALSFDDSYGYDYRDAVPRSNAMDIRPLPQRCPSGGFSPSSTGSVGSFQDALQDMVSMENVHHLTSSDNVKAVPSQNIPAKQTVIGKTKNRKEKKRRSSDTLSDNRALSFDDCYGYDYRDAVPRSNAMDIRPLPQRCPSGGFSPSSAGSVGSFQDALQDMVPVENAHLLTSSDNGKAARVSVCEPPQKIPAKQTVIGSPPVPETMNTITSGDRHEKQHCDMEPNRAGFVVFTEYDVLTTPSASPARRRTLNLCEKISAVWSHQHADDSQQEEDDEEELNHSDYTSDDFTEDEGEDVPILGGIDGHECYDDDDDDDSVVFCEDYDELNDDSNSSSGFDERKVRFNMKPVVHVMRAWDFAYRQARKGDWEMAARDRERFRKRIADLEPVLGPALQSALRDKIYAERFSGQDKYAQDLKLEV